MSVRECVCVCVCVCRHLTSHKGPFSTSVAVDPAQSKPGQQVYRLASRALLRDLQEKRSYMHDAKFGLTGKYTEADVTKEVRTDSAISVCVVCVIACVCVCVYVSCVHVADVGCNPTLGFRSQSTVLCVCVSSQFPI